VKAFPTEIDHLPHPYVDATKANGHPPRGRMATLRELKPQALGRKPLSDLITIKTVEGVKHSIYIDTYHAIRRAIPIYADDRRVASLVALPCEGITPDIVAHIRRRMITTGRLTLRAYSRRNAIA